MKIQLFNIMVLYPLFQAVKHRKDNSEVLVDPIFGHSNTWLGKGYYFWDGAIELAHWWGKVHYQNCYDIYQAKAEFDDSVFFDLFGSTSDLRLFRDVTKMLQEKFNYPQLTVSAVLNEMRKRTSFSNTVIRARSEHWIPGSMHLRFVDYDRSFMVMLPAVQVCITDRSVIKEYKKIFTQP